MLGLVASQQATSHQIDESQRRMKEAMLELEKATRPLQPLFPSTTVTASRNHTSPNPHAGEKGASALRIRCRGTGA